MSHPETKTHGITLTTDDGGRTLLVTLTGKLHTEDYDAFVPAVDEAVEKNGKVSMLVDLVDFHGWTIGAAWRDTVFAARHFHDIDRLAMVGDRQWEEGMATFCRPFTKAEVRFFEREDRAEAEAWVRGAGD